MIIMLQNAKKVIALKDENKEIKENRCCGFMQKYNVCSSEHWFELLDKGDAYDLQKHSRANTELHKNIDIDTVGSGRSRNHKTITDKNSRDRLWFCPVTKTKRQLTALMVRYG